MKPCPYLTVDNVLTLIRMPFYVAPSGKALDRQKWARSILQSWGYEAPTLPEAEKFLVMEAFYDGMCETAETTVYVAMGEEV